MVNSNCDFPKIIINSVPAPELVFNLVKKSDLKEYIEGVRLLERAGADFVVMICNTIHLFIDELQKEVKIPIVNLRELMRRYLWQQGL